MTSTTILHDEVDALQLTSSVQEMILHALIDAGRITVLECQYENCLFDDRRFIPGPTKRGKNRQGIVVDHIISRHNGGSNRPTNLQTLHHACNGHKAAFVDIDRDAVAAAKSAASTKRWEDPEYRRNMAEKRRAEDPAKTKRRADAVRNARHKISAANIGHPSPMKGRRHSAETKRKISEVMQGRTPWNKAVSAC